jgi:hypothetical protein
MSNIFSKIVDGIKAVAPTVANLALPGSGSLVSSMMRAVTGDGPDTPIEAVAAKIEANPKMFLELQTKAMDHEARMAEVDAKKLAIVNATMQKETQSDKWPQYSWRPFNGFTFPLAVICIYFVLPMIDKAVPAVPHWVWLGWLSILGVATYDRGKEKRAKAGEKKTGLLEGAIAAIRGKA